GADFCLWTTVLRARLVKAFLSQGNRLGSGCPSLWQSQCDMRSRDDAGVPSRRQQLRLVAPLEGSLNVRSMSRRRRLGKWARWRAGDLPECRDLSGMFRGMSAPQI